MPLSRRVLLAAPLLGAPLLGAAAPAVPADGPTVTDFSLTRLEGGTLPLAEFRGRVLLVVNTASFCGFTAQYEGLQRLHDRFAARGFAVVGVPSGDFAQESADERAIKDFCEGVFGITFPMAGLTPVRGAGAHPLFRHLAAVGGGPPRWNFHKYLVARDGRRVTAFGTPVAPEAPALVRAVEAALAVPVG